MNTLQHKNDALMARIWVPKWLCCNFTERKSRVAEEILQLVFE